MTRVLSILCVLCALLLNFPARAESPSVYYVDFAGGADYPTNNGLSTAAPWQHAPFFANGTAAGYSHVPGDQFIFKGGVTWPVACFPMTVTSGGTYNVQDYYGTNAAWYSGASWSPPIWDCQLVGATGSAGFLNATVHQMVLTFNAHYITFDSIVVTNLNWSGTAVVSGFNLFTSHGIVLTNMQFLCFSNLTGGSGSDSLDVVNGEGAAGAASNRVTHCLFTGLPNTQWSGKAIYYGTQVDHCTFHDMPNFIVGGFTNVAYNFMTSSEISVDSTQHDNVMEVFGLSSPNQNFYIHHNVESNNTTGEPMIVTPGTSGFGYIYDNLMIGNATGNASILADGQISGSASTGTLNIWNNTFQDAGGNTWVRVLKNTGGSQWATVNFTNNFFITENAGPMVKPDSGVTTTVNIGYSLLANNATATADGYGAANSYQPTSSGQPTVAQGFNLSYFMGTTAGFTTDILGVSRGFLWDIGAYQYFSPTLSIVGTPGAALKIIGTPGAALKIIGQ